MRTGNIVKGMLLRFHVLFRYKDLIKQLVIKDIKLKYRRSFLGYVWSVLNPLLIMVVMYLVFSQIFRVDQDNYPTYLIIGQSLFNFMTEATNQAIGSIVGNGSLLKKVYVPKYIFTLSKITSSLVNMIFSLVAMFIVFVVSGVRFCPTMLFIPVVVLEVYLFSLGLGLFLASSAVFFRDIQYIYSVFTTAWMYLTPIFYSISMLSENTQKVMAICNPMYIYITHFRTICLNQTLPIGSDMAYGFCICFLFLFLGTFYFFKCQDEFVLYI